MKNLRKRLSRCSDKDENKRCRLTSSTSSSSSSTSSSSSSSKGSLSSEPNLFIPYPPRSSSYTSSYSSPRPTFASLLLRQQPRMVSSSSKLESVYKFRGLDLIVCYCSICLDFICSQFSPPPRPFKNFFTASSDISKAATSASPLSPAIVEPGWCSPISSLQFIRDMLLVLFKDGICAVYSLGNDGEHGRGEKDETRVSTPKFLRILNNTSDKVIRTLFYNNKRAELMIVFVKHSESFTNLHVSSFDLSDFTEKDIFAQEVLKYPGFIEFYSDSGRIVTFDSISRIYRIWEMDGYDLLFEISGNNVREIKRYSSSLILVVRDHLARSAHLQIDVVNVSDGSLVETYYHLVHRQRAIEYIEVFNSTILIKQRCCNLNLYSVPDKSLSVLPDTSKLSSTSLLFLYSKNIFLSCSGGGGGLKKVSAWNDKGDRVFHPHHFDSFRILRSFLSQQQQQQQSPILHVVESENVIFEYQDRSTVLGDVANTEEVVEPWEQGRIRIWSLLEGKCLGSKIIDERDRLLLNGGFSGSISALGYDRERRVVMAGTKNSGVLVWRL